MPSALLGKPRRASPLAAWVPAMAADASATAASAAAFGPAAERTAERTADALQRFHQLRGDDPDLVRGAGRAQRQGMQVLVRQDLRVRVGVVDRAEHGFDRLGLPLGLQDAGLPVAFGSQDSGLLVALRGQDLRLLDAFGVEDGGAAVPLG